MTVRTNARLAGLAFLFYIIIGIGDMMMTSNAMSGKDTAAKLASIAQHATVMRVASLLALSMAMCALVLGVTLYALTRDADRDLALLAMSCRIVEGTTNAIAASNPLRLLSVATAATGAVGMDAAAANALGASLMGPQASGGIIFSVGSTIFCYLFLRARNIPAPLAWLGLVASLLLVVALPLELLHVIQPNWFTWLPMLAFEVTLGFWLIVKGVR